MQNTKHPGIALALLLGAFLISSCGQQYYRARPNDPPLLTGKGEGKIAGMFNLSTSSMPRFSAAWSPVKHLGLQAGHGASGSTGHTSDDTQSYPFSERRSFGYAGIGYYTALPKQLHFEIYGGAGAARYQSRAMGYVQRLHLTNGYLQPAIAYRIRNFELAASLRYDYLHRGRTEVDTSFTRSDNLHRFLDVRDYHMLQPGLTMRAGGQVKFCFEFYESFMLNRKYESVYGSIGQHGVAQYSVGIQWTIRPGLFK
ncbi:MAG: hypothetical protein EOO15_12740 [Chitinophagaceae bacterium]|nr:MAG: hypothetical protein EOO15_12740 [Chitinophagaceae bacterium]